MEIAMRITKLIRKGLLLIIVLLLFTACDDGNTNPYPDTGNTQDKDAEILDSDTPTDDETLLPDNDSDELGGLGDPCKTAQDCQMQYKCLDGTCVEDEIETDKDLKPDIDTGDSTPDDDGNTGDDLDSGDTTDEDMVDTAPDEDSVDDEWLDWDGTAICGNGIVEPGENCDDHNNRDDDYCGNDCLTVNGACGDNIKQKYEKCDDGNTDSGDYCSADCQTVTGACGDGVIQTGETCDDGDDNGKYGFCTLICDGAGLGCGDGVLQGIYERCDDGNIVDGDYCSVDCQTITGVCGDGTIQIGETCDDGNRDDDDYCSADCQTQNGSCGDGIRQSFEECEDGNAFTDNCIYGNTSGCTVCSAICKNVPGGLIYCGDGAIDIDNSEICDDGVENGSYGKCATDCKNVAIHCGDGIIQGTHGESCDDGDDNGIYGHCSGSCDGMAYCGDGVRDPAHELCDDGNNVAGDYCSGDCQIVLGFCRDDIKQDNEECDDGNTINDDYCTVLCKDNGHCGDNITQSNENCDDGIYNNLYGYCNNTCDGMGLYCGDGILTTPQETCEVGHSIACTTYGEEYMDGDVSCKLDCTKFDSSQCDRYTAPSFFQGTGIESCYNNLTAEPKCPSPGQGFYGQDGNFDYPLYSTTLEIISGDIVINTAKEVVLQGTLPSTYPGCTLGSPTGAQCSADEAANYCASLSYAGFSDWDIPDIEVFAFVLSNYSTAPHITEDLVSLSDSTSYWSKTTHESNQWIYNLADTTTSLVAANTAHKIRCARNIPSETLYDHITFTTKSASGDVYYSESLSQTDWTPPITTGISWENALSHCIQLSYAEFSNWRLPNEVELLILSNKKHYNPASVFPNISPVPYWSTTTSVEATEKAFVVDMLDGSTTVIDKNQSHHFYCVRSY